MKRHIHHLVVWLAYWSILIYLDYFWLKANSADLVNQNYLLLKVAAGTLLYMAPLAALAYYIISYGLEFVLDRKKTMLFKFAVIFIPYVLTIIAAIAMVRLVVFPYIFLFKKNPGDRFIDPVRFLSIMMEAAFPAAFLMALKFIDTRFAAAAREKHLIKEKLSAELQLLKSQLNPHFLFNTLNNIYALARKKSDLTPDVVLKLSELLSFTLYETGGATVPADKEIKFLDDYIALQKIRYDDRLQLAFVKEIDDPAQPVAPFILLPLVENAFKHGAGENHFDSFIHISLQLKNGLLHFTVENSTETTGKPETQKNIGLHNIRRQLELIYKEHELVVTDKDQIFKVALFINLNSHGNF
jgi:sensor histidine kinase YesM